MRLTSMAALLGAFVWAAVAAAPIAHAGEKKYGPGVTDTEIKIGQTMPYSGPASTYGAIGKTQAAYFAMVNAKGGVNGRKIVLLSYDDAYSPPKTVEQTRRLIEGDNVLLIFGSAGTAPTSAVHKYLNAKGVPQILLLTGGEKWNDPKNYPWTMALYPSYRMEARIYAKYLLQNKPDAKVAIIHQHDDMGKDFVEGFREGLGEKAKTMIVADAAYEVSDPTIDSQVISLKASGADTLFSATSHKFAAQVIRKVHDIGWKPLFIQVSVASSIGSVLEPAGLEKAVGIITAQSAKTPMDAAWADDKAMQDYIAFMKEWNPDGKIVDTSAVAGYNTAVMLVRLLEQCGDDLTRENVMRQVANIPESTLPLLLPGVTIRTTPDNYSAFRSLRMQRFDGRSWVLFGDLIQG